ncbi:hypothetical protein AUP68_00512 [Ilyonectria robusta]
MVRPFLAEVALRRITDMLGRAARVTSLLDHFDQMQKDAKNRIVAILEQGMVTYDEKRDEFTGLYIPDMQDLEWKWAYNWITMELHDLKSMFDAREAEFRSRQPSRNAVRDHTIWSSWGLADRRKDPEGSERILWPEHIPDYNTAELPWYNLDFPAQVLMTRGTERFSVCITMYQPKDKRHIRSVSARFCENSLMSLRWRLRSRCVRSNARGMPQMRQQATDLILPQLQPLASFF